jgi:signal peptidase I
MVKKLQSNDIAYLTETTLDPSRLDALCSVWQGEDREICLTLQGRSMVPTFLPGTRLRLYCGSKDIAPGDVIAYRQGSLVIVHRVISVLPVTDNEDRQFVCLGDGNITADAPFPEKDIVGVVIHAVQPAIWLRILYFFRHPRRYCRGTLRTLARKFK